MACRFARSLFLVACFSVAPSPGMAFGAPILDYPGLKAIIADHAILSIEDLLAYLKSAGYPIVDNYALVYRSRSLQFASPEFPRVVLLGHDGAPIFEGSQESHIFLAFAGDARAPAAGRLEVISFDGDAATFRFEEVIFADGRVRFDEAPPSCATCHGTDGRPIWDSYRDWPGVYGSADDYLADTAEKTRYQAFLAQNARSGRYEMIAVDPTLIMVDDPGTRGARRNRDLTFGFNTANWRANAERLKRLPQYDGIKYAIVGTEQCFALSGDTPELTGYFPNEVAADVTNLIGTTTLTTLHQTQGNHTERVQRLFAALGEPLPGGTDAGVFLDQDTFDVKRTATIRALVQLAGGSIAAWSMAMAPQSYAFAVGGQYGYFHLAPYLLDGEALDCAALKAKSHEVSRSLIGTKIPTTPTPDGPVSALDEQAVLLRCSSCHASPADGRTPFYPFAEPQSLRTMLLADGGALMTKMAARVQTDLPDLRMPPAPHRALSREEKKSFVAFLNRLVLGEE